MMIRVLFWSFFLDSLLVTVTTPVPGSLPTDRRALLSERLGRGGFIGLFWSSCYFNVSSL